MTQPSGEADAPSTSRAAGSSMEGSADRPAVETRTHWLSAGLRNVAPPATLMILAITIGLTGWSTTGPNWPDSPRYANAAAMIHDYIVSGDWSNPIEFAQENYATYPAFNVPFHPPGYPGLMALWFLVTGVNYLGARAFIAFLAGVSVCAFYAILRRGLDSRAACFACALLLLTTPAFVRWSRCTMSETPALAFILLASICFLKWMDEGRARYVWLAFGLAEIAFLCRVTTAGSLPGWFLFALLMRRPQRVFSWHVVLASLIYLLINFGYVKFAAHYAAYEVAADGKAALISWENLRCFKALKDLWYWGTILLGLFGFVLSIRLWREFPLGLFWFCWFTCYMLFKLAVPTTDEIRHFYGAIVALAGLTACMFAPGLPSWANRRLMAMFMILGLALNVFFAVRHTAVGLVGYDRVAEGLASLSERGNVLLCCIDEQELIFRYRGHVPTGERRMLRGDRTLALRSPIYAKVPATILANNADDVLRTIRQGRAKYVVTCRPELPEVDDRPEEMRLAHDVISANAEDFQLIQRYPLLVHYSGPGVRYEVYLWKYKGELPAGPSELPVRIPTSGMSL